MESLRKRGQLTGPKNKESFPVNFRKQKGIISHLVTINDVKTGIGKKITQGILEFLDIEVGKKYKVSELIKKIQKFEEGVKIEKLGIFEYPEGMTADINEIFDSRESFKVKFFSNVLSDGKLGEEEFVNILELMKATRKITDVTIDLSTGPNKKGYHITLVEVDKINDGPFYERTDIMKIWIAY